MFCYAFRRGIFDPSHGIFSVKMAKTRLTRSPLRRLYTCSEFQIQPHPFPTELNHASPSSKLGQPINSNATCKAKHVCAYLVLETEAHNF